SGSPPPRSARRRTSTGRAGALRSGARGSPRISSRSTLRGSCLSAKPPATAVPAFPASLSRASARFRALGLPRRPRPSCTASSPSSVSQPRSFFGTWCRRILGRRARTGRRPAARLQEASRLRRSLPAGGSSWRSGGSRHARCPKRCPSAIHPTAPGRVSRGAATSRDRRTPGPPFLRMETYSAKPGEIQRDWLVVDAEGKTLGRLATVIAERLRGKGKPSFTPHVDTGDFVVVVNAEKIAVTGNKLDEKMYYKHSGYPGGLRERTLRVQLERQPTEVLRKAVKGMLPRNKLGRAQLTKLKIYAGPEHPHEAQAPTTLEV